MKPRSQPATKEERARYAALKSMPCAACRQIGVYTLWSDVQHITSGGRRIGNYDSYPLCKWHHQGYIPAGFNLKNSTEAKGMFGPSFAKSKREFEERFGTEEELLAQTNLLLGIKPDPWEDYETRGEA